MPSRQGGVMHKTAFGGRILITRAELQKNYRESVDQNWSYMFRRVVDLSHAGTE